MLQVNSVHYTECETHHILNDITYVTECPPPPSVRCLPLYQFAKLLESSSESNTVAGCYDDSVLKYSLEHSANPTLSGRHVSAEVGADRILGMIYKDLESLER